ncbi:MAG: S-layer protein [Candidatus Woesearchaeota archaeon]|nr:S-layer protein [Candidatus Woesearchaeota archaeon]
MFIVEKNKNEILSLPAKEISARDSRHLSSELAVKILNLLSAKEMYVIEISKALKVNEQKVYYHVRKLEKAGIVKVVKSESKQGALAKYYALEEPSFVVKFRDFENSPNMLHLGGESPFFEPFIKDGQLDAFFIVGSPDPHGPDKARSRDGYYAVDFALFLGTFLNYVPSFTVKLDTEVKDEDLKENLILIGGPVTNRIVKEVNPKLPVRFEKKDVWSVYSTLSGKSYSNDEIGIIVKAKNPFNPGKSILILAGRRYSGTRRKGCGRG